MTSAHRKGKDRQQSLDEQADESDEESFEIEDVSTWLASDNENDEDDTSATLLKTPTRIRSPVEYDDLLKSSPPSPIFYQYIKREVPLPKPPVFKTEQDKTSKGSSGSNSKEDLDLDAFVAGILHPPYQKRVMKKSRKENDKPVMMECPICSRLFPKEKIEIHASDCTGAYSESDEEEASQDHGKRKKTMASGIAKSEAIRIKKYKNIQQLPINYYLQSDDMVATDSGDFASSSSGLHWESAGQTRFS